MAQPARLLYCNCTYAQVVPKEVKEAVLKKLCEAGVAFEAVADLCEMSARRDPSLKRLAEGTGGIKIAACYPRAVKWLFAAAGAPLPENAAEVLNMRVQNGEEVFQRVLNEELKPNLPAGKVSAGALAHSGTSTIASVPQAEGATPVSAQISAQDALS
jgi:hypothetical protein